MAVRISAAVAVILAHLIAIALIVGTDPEDPEVASDGDAIAGLIWMGCAILALVLAGLDAFEKIPERRRKHWAWGFSALVVLSIVIGAAVG